MKRQLLLASFALALSGCVVAPVGPIAPPIGVVRIEPTYPAPAIGYHWAYHPSQGWGWYHPQYGWHRGWR